MRNRVVEALKKECQGCENRGTCVVTEIECGLENQPSFGKVCELWEWSCKQDGEHGLPRRCELVSKILKIPEFAKVEPADAHYYIAFLAREGFIEEIITTNYDTCIEKAYLRTFGLEGTAPEEGSPALVIDNLAEYRAKGGRKFTGEQGKQRCLKIYKINGCASRLCNKNPEDGDCDWYCKNILLTEKDLQDWRNRDWARDLFRDRLRSRTILFSGFGSDEPQVRHTALQVCEEFASETGRELNTGEEIPHAIWEKPNAPFMAAYENSLSFSQTQILHAYAQSSRTLVGPEELKENAFLGSDIKFFSPGSSREELPADLFWKRVFQAAFWKRLRNACVYEGAMVSFLSPVLPCARALLTEMLDWLDPRDEPDRNFGRFPEMLELSEDDGKIIPLVQWVKRVRRTEPANGPGWYSPLADRPVLIPAILLLIYLLIGLRWLEIPWEALKAGIGVDDGPFGLLVDTHCLFGDATGAVYVAHRRIAENLPKQVKLQTHACTNVIIQIVLGPWQDGMKKIRLITDHSRVKQLTVRQISLLSLFKNARSVPEAKAVFPDMLRKTFLLIDSARSRVRDRSRPLSSRRDKDGK